MKMATMKSLMERGTYFFFLFRKNPRNEGDIHRKMHFFRRKTKNHDFSKITANEYHTEFRLPVHELNARLYKVQEALSSSDGWIADHHTFFGKDRFFDGNRP